MNDLDSRSYEELEEALADMTDQRDRLLRILELALATPAKRVLKDAERDPSAISMVEKSLLGSILSTPGLLEHVKIKLLPSHFTTTDHGNIWTALTAFIAEHGSNYTMTWLLGQRMEPTAPYAVVLLSKLLDHAILDELDIPIYAKAIRNAAIARRIR